MGIFEKSDLLLSKAVIAAHLIAIEQVRKGSLPAGEDFDFLKQGFFKL